MKFPNTLIEKATGPKDIRSYLHEVYLDTDKKRLIATNGHIAVIVPVELSEQDTSGPVSADALKAARRTTKSLTAISEPEIICTDVLTVTNGPTFPRSELSGKFPDVDRIMPKKKGRIKISFNAQLLVDLALAIGEGKHKTGVCLHIDPNDGETAIYVSNNSDRYGVIMPMRL